MKPKIAIDIGTSFTKIYKAKTDVVLVEPTVIAVKNGNYSRPVACGKEALSLVGKVADDTQIIFPVSSTDILDYKALVALIEYFVKKIKLPFEVISDVLLTVQCGSTREVIKKFENALIGAKIYNVCFAEAPILALIGAGAELTSDVPSAVIDFGGGQTTVCVLTPEGVISGASMEIGGNHLNQMIMEHTETALNLSISSATAELLKTSLASLDEDDETKIVISGKDNLTGKNRSMQISASQIYKPVREFLGKVLQVANMIISRLGGDTLSQILKSGVYLTGGGSAIYGLGDYVSSSLGIKAEVVSEAEIAVIKGAGKLVENKELLEKLKLKV
ncbi:MAG: rod shape-determining protein [Clostridia bacterium]|nr:rod shape-determining protein [Clostridia bacterium]